MSDPNDKIYALIVRMPDGSEKFFEYFDWANDGSSDVKFTENPQDALLLNKSVAEMHFITWKMRMERSEILDYVILEDYLTPKKFKLL